MLAHAVEWREDEGSVKPYLLDQQNVEVAWAPQPGSQELFVSCPVTEVLYEGNRGGGKTLCLLMDFAQHVGQGFGAQWRGILFRREFVQLKDVIDKSLEWFPRLWPEARYNKSDHVWEWPTGEKLYLAHIKNDEEYHKYHGWGLCWIGWEELTTWPTLGPYLKMFSVLRSTNPLIPRKVRATTNPMGPGHNLVKHRFQLPIAPGKTAGPIIRDEKSGVTRVAIRSKLAENKILTEADPDYRARILAAAGSESERKAWDEGDWNIVAGGMLDDIWDQDIHVVPPVPMKAIPATWRLDRSYDDGLTKPFSVCWWGQSSGEPITWEGRRIGEVRGDLVMVYEWYGWNGTPNEGIKLSSREIAKGIISRQVEQEVAGRVRSGPADSAIYNSDPRDPGQSVAGDMAKEGVSWEKADKRPGSRIQGWKQLRQMLKEAIPKNGRREKPGLFISEACVQALRTLPVLQRDKNDPDDVDTETEDHIADAVRYRCRRPRVVEKPVPNLPY